MPPCARITDPVVHPLPPVLQPGPGSFNTMCGYLPVWRGVLAAAAASLSAAKGVSDGIVMAAQAATLAAAGTPGAPAAKAAEEAIKLQQAAQMASMITSMAGGADIHVCATVPPPPPHGPGVVIDGSPTVLINNLPCSRMGDTILESFGPPNKIAMGCPTVMVGNVGQGCSISGSSGSGTPGTPQPGQGSGQAKYQPASGGVATTAPPTQAAVDEGTLTWSQGQPSRSSQVAASALQQASKSGTGLVVCGPACQALKKAAGPLEFSEPKPPAAPPSISVQVEIDSVNAPERNVMVQAKVSGVPFIQSPKK